jgi:hypothetical protein
VDTAVATEDLQAPGFRTSVKLTPPRPLTPEGCSFCAVYALLVHLPQQAINERFAVFSVIWVSHIGLVLGMGETLPQQLVNLPDI